jgi:hypothetical protein
MADETNTVVEIHPKVLMDAALKYAERGFRVLPLHTIKSGICSCGDKECRTPAKHPLTLHGAQEASNDEMTIRGWWSKWPQANIGLAMGDAGCVAIDIDTRNLGHLTWEQILAQNGELPETPTQRTGNGQHYLVRIDPAMISRVRGKLGPGIDIKANGYIVAEPSIHHSGRRYAWDDGLDPLQGFMPAQAPVWLERMLLEPLGGNISPNSPNLGIVTLPVQLQEAADALSHLDADEYHQWIEAGMALHATGLGNAAYQTWVNWSQDSSKFDHKLQRAKWVSFGRNRQAGVTIKTLFSRAQAVGWVNPLTIKRTGSSSEPLNPDGLILNLDQLRERASGLKWLVKHVIPDNSIGMFFGASGTYKSFIALDFGFHMAHGLPWLDRKTRGGAVVYIAAEGGAGLWNRIRAWHLDRKLAIGSIPFYVCPVAVNLGEESSVLAVQKAILDLGIEPRMVVVDTLSQTFAGDENKREEAAAYLRSLGAQIRARFACTVLLIHHTGHSTNERPRGSSAFIADLDFLFGVFKEKEDPIATMECLKQKDGDKIENLNFQCVRHVLDHDEDGDEITSLAAIYTNQVSALVAAVAARQDSNYGKFLKAAQMGTPVGDAKKVFFADLGSGKAADTKAKAWSRSLNWAQKANLIRVENGVFFVISGPDTETSKKDT